MLYELWIGMFIILATCYGGGPTNICEVVYVDTGSVNLNGSVKGGKVNKSL